MDGLYWGIPADTVSARYQNEVIDYNDIAIVCNGRYLGHPAYVTYIFHDNELNMVTHNLRIEGADWQPFFSVFEELQSTLGEKYGQPIECDSIGLNIGKEDVFDEIGKGQRQLNCFWLVGDTRLILSLKKSRMSDYPVSIVVLYSRNQQ